MINSPPPLDLAEQLMAIEEKLANDLMKLSYEFPVEYVYNPIKHAKELHYNFLKRYSDAVLMTKSYITQGRRNRPA